MILILLLSSFIHAQENCNPSGAGKQCYPQGSCDPVETEKECYAQLCSNNIQLVVSMDLDELGKASEKHPYNIEQKYFDKLEKNASIAESIKGTAKEVVSPKNIKKYTKDILDSPVEGIESLISLFYEDIKCVETNGKCLLVTNDLVQYSENMKSLYRKMYEQTMMFRANEKKYYVDALEAMGSKYTNEFKRKEKNKILKLYGPGEFNEYVKNAKWVQEYKTKVGNDLGPFQKDLEEALLYKINKNLNVDNSSAGLKKQMIGSCQVSSYLKKVLKEQATDQLLSEKATEAVNSIKNNFLSNLSEHSANVIGKTLSSIKFYLIKNSDSQFMDSKAFDLPTIDSPDKPKSIFNKIEDISLLAQSFKIQCVPDGILPSDNASSNSISVSQISLVNNSAVIYHELGHWLSREIQSPNISAESRKKLLKVKTCVSSYYLEEKSNKTEEDFADWFLSQTSGKAVTLQCEIRKFYKSYYNKMGSSYVPASVSYHSSGLFREIAIRLNKGESIPQVCKDMMNLYPKYRPKKCTL